MILNLADQRIRVILKAIISGAVGKVIGMLSTLLTIPIMVKCYGVEDYGIWTAIIGVISMLSFADFGVGLSLQNAISKCVSLDDYKSASKYISTAYGRAVIGCVWVATLSVILILLIPVDRIISTTPGSLAWKVKILFLIMIPGSILGIIPQMIHRILIAQQKSHLSNYITMTASVLSVTAVVICVSCRMEFVVTVLVYMVIPILLNLCVSIYCFYVQSWMRPTHAMIDKQCARELRKTGLWAVWVQLGLIVKINAPVLVISFYFGVVAVARYSTVQRLFGVIAMVTTLALQPLWPAYADSIHKRDVSWLKSMYRKTTVIVVFISVLGSLVLVLIGPKLIMVWTKSKDLVPSWQLVGLCGGLMIASCLNTCSTMLLNGASYIKQQAFIGTIGVVGTMLFAVFCGGRVSINGFLLYLCLVESVIALMLMFMSMDFIEQLSVISRETVDEA